MGYDHRFVQPQWDQLRLVPCDRNIQTDKELVVGYNELTTLPLGIAESCKAA